MNHSDYMRQAINLAECGRGWTTPNPLVGCVIVKQGNVIAQGYHQRYGEWHAERNAILNSTADLQGATVYITLEPCCHYGRTPPCTDLLIEKQVACVIIGSRDPNPLVAGQGIMQLRRAGIKVIEGVLQAECDQLNSIFFHYIQHKRPYVLMKYAMTADGKIATCTGESKWITSKTARMNVQQTRHQYSAIMVGIGTVLTDDPLLNCRLEKAKQPARIICDSLLRTPLNSQLVHTAKQYRTIIGTLNNDQDLHHVYQQAGVEIMLCKRMNKRIDLADFLQKLAAIGIDSVLLEGGSELNFRALAQGLVNRIHCYIAPKLFGGLNAKTAIGGEGIANIERAVRLHPPKISLLDEDILLDFEVKAECLQVL